MKWCASWYATGRSRRRSSRRARVACSSGAHSLAAARHCNVGASFRSNNGRAIASSLAAGIVSSQVALQASCMRPTPALRRMHRSAAPRGRRWRARRSAHPGPGLAGTACLPLNQSLVASTSLPCRRAGSSGDGAKHTARHLMRACSDARTGGSGAAAAAAAARARWSTGRPRRRAGGRRSKAAALARRSLQFARPS